MTYIQNISERIRGQVALRKRFFDRSLVDPVESKDESYIRRSIRNQVHGTSATVVLIGYKTHTSRWVDWESVGRGNGLLEIKLKGKSGASMPASLRTYGAEVLIWQPSQFEDAIERAAVAASW